MSDGDNESVEAILETVEEIDNGSDTVCVRDVVKEIGSDAFGPLMLLPALIIVSPASGIPMLPTICGLLIALISAQMVIGREHLWLPGFLLKGGISKKRLEKATSWLQRPARLVDSITRTRLSFLTEKPWRALPAAICVVTALLMPVLELVPFSSTVAAAAISLYALGFVARDGLFVIFGFAVTAMIVYLGWSIAV